MAFITVADRQRIEAAIRAAEARTSGEFVTVVARTSDHYLTLPILYASGLALMTPLVLWLLRIETQALPLFLIQVAVFVTLALVFLWPPVTMRLVPHGAKLHHAARLAREQFFMRGLHETADRHGVLLFVSVAERYVEIVADRGIHAKVPDGAWDGIVGDFTRTVGEGRVADGFVLAIERCGGLLASHFPRRPEDRDELANRLFEI
jgi:putative membrane protein